MVSCLIIIRVRYDGFPFIKTPKLKDLPENAQNIIRSRTPLDRVLYDEALVRWKALVAREGPSFQSELAAFHRVQAMLEQVCEGSSDHPACVWYSLNDIQFCRMIRQYRTAPIPFEF